MPAAMLLVKFKSGENAVMGCRLFGLSDLGLFDLFVTQ